MTLIESLILLPDGFSCCIVINNYLLLRELCIPSNWGITYKYVNVLMLVLKNAIHCPYNGYQGEEH